LLVSGCSNKKSGPEGYYTIDDYTFVSNEELANTENGIGNSRFFQFRSGSSWFAFDQQQAQLHIHIGETWIEIYSPDRNPRFTKPPGNWGHPPNSRDSSGTRIPREWIIKDWIITHLQSHPSDQSDALNWVGTYNGQETNIMFGGGSKDSYLLMVHFAGESNSVIFRSKR
jgi:hypothetical protein